MNRALQKVRTAMTVALVASGLAGCMAARSTLEAIEGELDFAKGGPVVEAFIEYTGPHSKWAGPQSFLLHLSARDSAEESGKGATLVISPAIFAEVEKAAGNRRGAARAPASTGMSVEVARSRLADLSNALQGDEEDSPSHEFRGCLYPLRVKLVRQDGAILEKHGCRAREGWSMSVSQFASDLIAGAVSVSRK